MALTTEGERWRHLKYVSMRLAKKYLDILAATGPAEGGDPHISVSAEPLPGLKIDSDLAGSRPQLDRSNPVAVARALDRLLAGTYLDLSQGVDAGRINRGALVRASLLFQPAHLQIQNYELVSPSREPYYVVAFSCLDFAPEIGRVFVGLVGSEHNLVAMPGQGIKGARSASDADGLYSMIQYTKEAYGIDIDPERIAQEPRLYQNATDGQRIQAVAETFRGFDLCAAPRPMDVLFEVHHVARNIDLEALRVRTDGSGSVDLAMFGAPVWIREATDRELLSSRDIVEGVGSVDESWESFDEELRLLISDEQHVSTWRPQMEGEFHRFGRWAAAWSRRVAPVEPGPLWFKPKKFKLFRWAWGRQVDAPIANDIYGWFVGNPDWNGFFLSTEGDLYAASRREIGPTYLEDGSPQSTGWDSPEANRAVQQVLSTITYWLLPFARE